MPIIIGLSIAIGIVICMIIAFYFIQVRPTMKAVRLKKKETEDVTTNTVDVFLNKDAAGTIGATAVANQAEDTDVNLTLNPVQVAQLQAQKDAEVKKVKADKAAKAKASQAAQKAKAGDGAEGTTPAKKKGLQGLGIDIAPEVAQHKPGDEQIGLAQIDAQIRK